MIYPATKDITVLREAPWLYVTDFRGVDFTDMDFAMQVRLYRGASGDPEIDLAMSAPGTEGISVAITTEPVEGGGTITVSTVTINVLEATINAVTPPAGTKAGADPVLFYDLKSTNSDGAFIPSRWLEGKFTIREGITD